MSTPYTLSDVMGRVLDALQTILYKIADAIASNAEIIATVFVVGGLTYAVYRYGSSIIGRIAGFFRAIF